MEFRFTVDIPDETPTPVALHCSRRLSDHLWESIDDDYEGVHMRYGRKVEANRFEFVWEMGLNDDPEAFARPDWIVACVPADGDSDDDSDEIPDSIIAAVGRTVTEGPEWSEESDEDVPF